MECERCNSDRILEVLGKCGDTCLFVYKGAEEDGYVPDDIPLSDRSGDYIKIKICLTCGQAQGMADSPDPKFYTREQEQEDE